MIYAQKRCPTARIGHLRLFDKLTPGGPDYLHAERRDPDDHDKTYDYLNRLTAVSSANAASVVLDSNGYAYNSANQRTSVVNADGTYWIYRYDSLGQVTSGVKYWPDGSVVAGQQFGYGFDDIGKGVGSHF